MVLKFTFDDGSVSTVNVTQLGLINLAP